MCVFFHTVTEEARKTKLLVSRFNQRSERLLNLPKYRQTSANSSPSPSPFGSNEDFTANCNDPSHSKLTVLSSGPLRPFPTERLDSNEDKGEEDYANPMDAIKSTPLGNKLFQDQFVHSPSPPGSPLPPEVPPRNSYGTNSHGTMSPYQTVHEVRKMREMQLRGKEMKEVKLRDKQPKKLLSKDGGAEACVNRYFQYDDNPGYSKPFDALPGNSSRLPTSDLKKSPPAISGRGDGGAGRGIGHGQRSNSSEKLCKEPSARFLHHVESGSSCGGHFPSIGQLPPIQSPNSNPDIRTIGLDHPLTLHTQSSFPNNSSKSGGQTCMSNSSTQVNRYILEVGDRQLEGELSRAETGRTSSVDSAHKSYTPTKLRNGRGRVAIGKFKSRRQTKEGQTKENH